MVKVMMMTTMMMMLIKMMNNSNLFAECTLSKKHLRTATGLVCPAHDDELNGLLLLPMQ